MIPAAAGIFAAGAIIGDSFFAVPQTDVAYVKRFGKVVNTSQGPLQPGLHLKLPFVDEPDLIRITTDRRDLSRAAAGRLPPAL